MNALPEIVFLNNVSPSETGYFVFFLINNTNDGPKFKILLKITLKNNNSKACFLTFQ